MSRPSPAAASQPAASQPAAKAAIKAVDPTTLAKNEWGPAGWAWGHTRAIYFPLSPTTEDRSLARRDVSEFIGRLPCPACIAHAKEYMQAFPVDVTSSYAFQRWWWTFHNAVNARLRKPQFTYEQYLGKYVDAICHAHPGG
jgi:hypothetical protein